MRLEIVADLAGLLKPAGHLRKTDRVPVEGREGRDVETNAGFALQRDQLLFPFGINVELRAIAIGQLLVGPGDYVAAFLWQKIDR
jgi:hypothetical protein